MFLLNAKFYNWHSRSLGWEAPFAPNAGASHTVSKMVIMMNPNLKKSTVLTNLRVSVSSAFFPSCNRDNGVKWEIPLVFSR